VQQARPQHTAPAARVRQQQSLLQMLQQ
jgi:hypothetical protein